MIVNKDTREGKRGDVRTQLLTPTGGRLKSFGVWGSVQQGGQLAPPFDRRRWPNNKEKETYGRGFP